MQSVYIVTDPELGWDCVIEVFDADEVTKEEVEEVFNGGAMVVHYARVVGGKNRLDSCKEQ